MKKISRILVPTDYSKSSHEAVHVAAEFCQVFRAELRLLHVVEVGMYGMYGPEAFWTTENLDLLRKSAMAEMEQFIEALELPKDQDFRITAEVEMSSKRAAEAIIEDTVKHQVDMIVMSTHGRSGFDHLIMGSVAERVIRTAKCPVLTLKALEGK
jgi:nucleotide-binding universal stress UspA family protein